MTDQSCCNNTRILVQDPKTQKWSGPITNAPIEEVKTWRRKCGCMRTSDKLKNILDTFPSAQPPTPSPAFSYDKSYSCGVYAGGHVDKTFMQSMDKCCMKDKRSVQLSRSWQVIAELVQLVQLSVTATALALYYLIYCYMQLVYYTLRSALYFHNADGPMKITIGVVTVTSLIVGFNLMLRMERILGILY